MLRTRKKMKRTSLKMCLPIKKKAAQILNPILSFSPVFPSLPATNLPNPANNSHRSKSKPLKDKETRTCSTSTAISKAAWTCQFYTGRVCASN